VFDCADLRQVYDCADSIPTIHSGYHYCSTAIEWKYLIDSIKAAREGSPFVPQVSLDDGIKAVEMGIASMKNITNSGAGGKVKPVTAHGSKSSENLLNHVLNGNNNQVLVKVIDNCDIEYKGNDQ